MRAVLAEMQQTLPPLRGVIHVAGIFDDSVLTRHDWDRFRRVLAAKARGGWILHDLTRAMSLDFFLLFGSSASFLGPIGLANYAAANAFLDGLAHERRRLGLPALTLDWGPWASVGMAGAVGQRREDQWFQSGFGTMTAREGLEVMERLMGGNRAQVGVLPAVEWATYLARFGVGAEPTLYAELAREASWKAARGSVAPPAAQSELLKSLDAALPAERSDVVLAHVQREIASVLGFGRSQRPDPLQGLFEIGMDSLTAVELKNRLQAVLKRPLPATIVFEYPSAQALTNYLAAHVLQFAAADRLAAEAMAAPDAPAPDDFGDDLTEDQLASLLAERLAAIGAVQQTGHAR
jgi:acyl carrier protein